MIRALARRVSRQILDFRETVDLSQSKQRFTASENKQRHRASGKQGTNWAQSCERKHTLQRQVNGKKWWARQDSNLGPTDYESIALTS